MHPFMNYLTAVLALLEISEVMFELLSHEYIGFALAVSVVLLVHVVMLIRKDN
jgi:hypothetical protein